MSNLLDKHRTVCHDKGMGETNTPEVTQGDVLRVMMNTGMSEQEAYDSLTIGKTVILHRQPARLMTAESLQLQHRFTETVSIEVRVHGPESRTPNGSVNWPGWGSQDPETTAVFAAMLAVAAELAPTLAPRRD